MGTELSSNFEKRSKIKIKRNPNLDLGLHKITFIDFPNQYVKSLNTPFACSRLVFFLLGAIYCFLLATTTGEVRKSVESLDYLLGLDVLADGFGRNVRIWIFVLGGRLIFDLIFYGPQRTLEGFTNKTIKEVITFPFKNATTRLFLGRWILEGIALVVGFIAMSAIGQHPFFGNTPPITRNGRAFENTANVPKKIRQDFVSLLDGLDARAVKSWLSSELASASP